MKHERTGNEGKITLAPGEIWVVDEQCMIMHQGYLADWVGYFEGDKFFLASIEEKPTMKNFLSPEGTVTFHIDYGTPIKCSGCGSEGFAQSVLGPGRCTFCDGTVGGHPPKPPTTGA